MTATNFSARFSTHEAHLRIARSNSLMAHIRLFSADLDGTLLGDPSATQRFRYAWEALHPGRRPLLVYNTGRTVANTLALVADKLLPESDFIIGSVGTELHDSLYNRGDEFRAQFGEGWDLAHVEEIVATSPGVRRQPAECQHPFKSSWHWVRARREDIEALQARFRRAGLQTEVIYSCGYFLDVVPARAGKGKALAWLCKRVGVPLPRVLVAGDTGNDTSMFQLPGVSGIVVENALPELLAAVPKDTVFAARASMADGVLEGLQHFKVMDQQTIATATPTAA
jgi:sucrose-6F-phosphate phosphohydrolase